ncbi:response regulator receiver domain-containing protein [Archangium gephyra]|uniref:Diguanylate cyclase/phosphodiesterase n=1 Tax=Archangium gephyra TaxID=48 RepID=A0AAC8TF27_9BACT|nr:response regulator [Archangium gephyra]AKJ03612.1 diguanylate cyclase/phosphodiesterase [Archangium gephyra]REG22607.1 response regulator receiver domain-containing protein [Archangium gephyra]
MMMTPTPNRRILIVDDNEDIHDDFRRILQPRVDTSELDDLEVMLLGETSAAPRPPTFELTSAHQGAEALEKIREALKAGTPYALAFIDMRMPPGWDGVETLSRIWQEDHRLQAVICSAYSDFSWESICSRFGQTDRFLILKKPFDAVEVRQMACALVEKWSHHTASQHAAQALHGNEARLRALLQVLPDALLRVAADGTCLEFLPSREATPAPRLAFPPGAKLADTLPADAARELLAHLSQALGGGPARVFELELPVEGEVRCFEARLAAIPPAEAFVLLRDVTAHRRAGAAARNPRP